MKNIANDLWKLSCMLPVLLTGVGCVAAAGEQANDDQADDEQVDTAEQAFSGYWGWWRATSDQVTPAMELGSASEMTCFLSGIGGDLDSSIGSSSAFDPLPPSGAYAGLYHQANRWYLQTYGDFAGTKVKATTICLPTTTNRTAAVHWSGGEEAKVLAPATANRQCGLMGVRNKALEWEDSNWFGIDDKVMIWNDGTNWYIGGTGSAEGWGGCVDVSSGSITSSSTHSWELGTKTFNLVQRIDHGTTPLGTQCFLTGIGGRFQYNSWSDGLFINYDPGSHLWTLTVTNYKTGDVTCVQ